MNGEAFNSQDQGIQNNEWQQMAEQIASHTTTDGHGESVYLGREIPEEMQASVEESGFARDPEAPRGSSEDGVINREVYPQIEGESDEAYESRITDMQAKTDEHIEKREKEEIDSFWSSHEDLWNEARAMHAPLDAESFKSEGFVFAREDDGNIHVWGPTPEYKRWLETKKNGGNFQELPLAKVGYSLVPQGETFRGKKYENLSEMSERKERVEHEKKMLLSEIKNLIGDYLSYSDTPDDFYKNPNGVIFDRELKYDDHYDSEVRREARGRLRDDFLSKPPEEQEVYFREQEKNAYIGKISAGRYGNSRFNFSTCDARIKNRINEIFDNNGKDPVLINAAISSSTGDDYDERIDFFKIADFDPIKLLTLDKINEQIDYDHYAVFDSKRHYIAGKAREEWGTRLQADGSFGQNFGDEIAHHGIIAHLASNNPEWADKCKRMIESKIDDFANELFKLSGNSERSVTFGVEEARFNIKEGYSEDEEDLFFIIPENRRNILNSEEAKEYRAQLSESILNLVSEEKLRQALAERGINLEYKSRESIYYEENYS